MNPSNPSTAPKKETGLNLVDILVYFLSKWKWFVLSVLLFGSLAWVKYARSPLVYFRSATVIIKDPSNKQSTAGGLNVYDNNVNNVNVANELLQFRSKKLMREVVRRVHADVSYQVKDGLRHNELYTQSPIAVLFVDATPESSAVFTVTPKNQQEVVISQLNDNDDDKAIVVKMNQPAKVGGMRVVVTPTSHFKPAAMGQPIRVTKMPLTDVTAYYQSALGIRQEEDEASILTLSLKDNSPVRADDVLNMLITVYNEEAIRDKNQVAVNTAQFISERLIIIGKELGDVEVNLEAFKRDNRMINVETSTSMSINESQKYSNDALELETQLQIARFIKDYLTDAKKDAALIPANMGLKDMNVESQINQYNAVKLRRDRLINESSDSNPVVEELNKTLHAMKQSIIQTVDNMITSYSMKRTDALSRERDAQSSVASIPTKERQMLSIERQQKIKESLYLFLLNRREENALSQAMVDNNARVIDSADGSNTPISPRRDYILLLGVLVGLAVPGVACLLVLFLDTRVRSRKDMEGWITIPFLGEIPIDKDQAKRKTNDKNPAPAAKHDDDLVSEAFRILRTNMAFMSKKDHPTQVITLTSLNEGAGKTFISRNFAASLASAKKRVILLDLDIRKGTLSRTFHLRKFGVTDYLVDNSVQMDDVIQHCGDFDIIASGTVAPNPAELLMDGRLDELVAELRKRYDYIIADSVPVGIIADATISNRIADLTLFVTRSGKIDRRQLPDIEELYQEKKLKNMAIVLNGVDWCNRYGYRYYGNYGHYSYYGEHKKKKRFGW